MQVALIMCEQSFFLKIHMQCFMPNSFVYGNIFRSTLIRRRTYSCCNLLPRYKSPISFFFSFCKIKIATHTASFPRRRMWLPILASFFLPETSIMFTFDTFCTTHSLNITVLRSIMSNFFFFFFKFLSINILFQVVHASNYQFAITKRWYSWSARATALPSALPPNCLSTTSTCWREKTGDFQTYDAQIFAPFSRSSMYLNFW